MEKTAFSIYNASAGSGKTYTLVKEYLKIILVSKKPDAYRNILAITFTNKAVNEMKSRVVDSLSEFSKEKPSSKAQDLMTVIAQETQLSISQIHLKANSIIINLIHNYAAFDISTIDKFTHKVIRAFAHDLKLPITFEISLDTDILLNEAVDSIISKAGEDPQLTKLLIDYTLEKTNDDKSWDFSKEIVRTGNLILNENNRDEIVHYKDKSIADFIEIKNKISFLDKEIIGNVGQLAHSILILIEENSIDTKSFPYETFPKHIVFLKNNDEREKNYRFTNFEDIKIKKEAKDKAIIESVIPSFLAILKEIYTKQEKHYFYEAFLKEITPLSLLNTLSNEIATIQSEQNIISIAEFNKLINEQIQNQPAPFIYERLGEKYKHFFIDEFQDTSIMQWQNLIPLIDNSLSSQNLDGEKGSLLIVGDPKQSIYRWRGGKAEQFIDLSKTENPFSNPSKKTFPLDTNYRSFSKIIDFNNGFFSYLSQKFENEDYKELYLNKSFQKCFQEKEGFVSISFLEKSDKKQEENNLNEEEDVDLELQYLQKIESTITQIITNNFNYKDVVILTRDNKKGVLISNYLTSKNIPIISSESLLLEASSEVKFIIYILRYLANKNDKESKASFIYYLAKNNNKIMPIHDFILEGISCQSEVEFQDWLRHKSINCNFETIKKKSLYEIVETIVSQLISPLKQNAYTQFFLDVVLERDIKNQSGIIDFLNYWDKKSHSLSISMPQSNDAVRIMTIHKSKGLEFPIVIFPFANENYSQHKFEKIWVTNLDSEINLPRVLVSKNKNVAQFGIEAAKTLDKKDQEDLLDAVNVLYVALTRAEEQLFIISEEIKENKNGDYPNSLPAFFINYLQSKNEFHENQLEYQFGNSTRVSIDEKEIQKTKLVEAVQSNLDFKKIKIAQKEGLIWNTKQQKSIEYGNLIHEILSFITNPDNIEHAITKAVEKGLIQAVQKEEVKATVCQIVMHEELQDYFSKENKVLNEQAIIQKGAGILKPDRISISKTKEVFLLDYKTGLHLPKHKQQLENYKVTIENMGYSVKKKALVYIGEKIEIVHL